MRLKAKKQIDELTALAPSTPFRQYADWEKATYFERDLRGVLGMNDITIDAGTFAWDEKGQAFFWAATYYTRMVGRAVTCTQSFTLKPSLPLGAEIERLVEEQERFRDACDHVQDEDEDEDEKRNKGAK